MANETEGLQQQTQDTESDIEWNLAAMLQTLASTVDALSTATAAVQTLLTSANSMSQETAGWKGLMSAVETTLSKSDERARAIDAHIAELETRVQGLDSGLVTATTTVTEFGSTLAGLATKLDSMLGRMEAVIARFETVSDLCSYSVQSLNQTIEATMSHVKEATQVSTKAAANSATAAGLVNVIQSVTSQLADILPDVRAVSTRLACVTGAAKDLNAMSDDAKVTLAVLRERADASKKADTVQAVASSITAAAAVAGVLSAQQRSHNEHTTKTEVFI